MGMGCCRQGQGQRYLKTEEDKLAVDKGDGMMRSYP